MGPSLGFVTDVFYFLCWAVLNIMVCSIAPLDLYCAIGDFKIAPLESYCAIVSGYYLSFKWSGKVVFLLGPELPTGDGWERASHWSCIAPLEIIFLDTIWVSSDQERLWRMWRWFVIWCGEFVWQWRKFKNSLYLNTVKTDGSCTADACGRVLQYKTVQYNTIQYLILKNYGVTILKINLYWLLNCVCLTI